MEAAEKLDAAKAAELVDHKVCVVTMAPIVNKDVTAGGVKNLTKAQLTDILQERLLTGKKLVVLMKQSCLSLVQNLLVQEQHLRNTH